MTQLSEKKQAIVTNLKEKSVLKQKVYDRTLEAFCNMKEILRNFAREVNGRLGSIDPRIRPEFRNSRFDNLGYLIARIFINHEALEFDLLVPPYDTVKIATAGQLEAKIQYSGVITGKRLGFQFNSDDVLITETHSK